MCSFAFVINVTTEFALSVVTWANDKGGLTLNEVTIRDVVVSLTSLALHDVWRCPLKRSSISTRWVNRERFLHSVFIQQNVHLKFVIASFVSIRLSFGFCVFTTLSRSCFHVDVNR